MSNASMKQLPDGKGVSRVEISQGGKIALIEIDHVDFPGIGTIKLHAKPGHLYTTEEIESKMEMHVARLRATASDAEAHGRNAKTSFIMKRVPVLGGTLILWPQNAPPRWNIPRVQQMQFRGKFCGLIMGYGYRAIGVGYVRKKYRDET